MRSLWYLWITTYLIIACESPYNNRRPSSDRKLQNSETSRLKVFKNFPYTVDIAWTHYPSGDRQIKNEILVVVKNRDSGLREDLPNSLSLHFYSTMPSMGHPMSDAGYFSRLDRGIYINSDIRFNMAGEWQHEIRLIDTDYTLLDKVLWTDIL